MFLIVMKSVQRVSVSAKHARCPIHFLALPLPFLRVILGNDVFPFVIGELPVPNVCLSILHL